ncbi:MAG: hypothetical protein WCC22_12045 [Terriglobales bacterium]
MRRTPIAPLLALIFLLNCHPPPLENLVKRVPRRPEASFLLAGLLNKFGTSASFVYRSNCASADWHDDVSVRLHIKYTESAVEALQKVFADEKTMLVTEEPGGMIRITDASVPQALLDVRMRRVYLTSRWGTGDVLYDPDDVAWAIIETPEVQAFMTTHDLHKPNAYSRLVPTPSPSLPHMSGQMENLTVREALDRTLQTFPGLWSYTQCVNGEGRKLISIGFYSIQQPRKK